MTKQKEDTEIKLVRAEKLVGGLHDESIRWTDSVKKLGKDLINLTGNSLLASAYVSYVGVFTAEYREKLL